MFTIFNPSPRLVVLKFEVKILKSRLCPDEKISSHSLPMTLHISNYASLRKGRGNSGRTTDLYCIGAVRPCAGICLPFQDRKVW
jgi:hypothetical protein